MRWQTGQDNATTVRRAGPDRELEPGQRTGERQPERPWQLGRQPGGALLGVELHHTFEPTAEHPANLGNLALELHDACLVGDAKLQIKA